MEEAQAEMNEAIWAVNDRFLIPSALLAAAQFFLSLALIFGGLKALHLQATGRKVLLAALSFLVLFEIAQLALFAMIQIELTPIMQVYMPRVMEAAPGSGPGGEKFAQSMAKFSMIAGLIMQGAWMLVKLTFLAIAIWYLGRQRTRLLFGDDRSHQTTMPHNQAGPA